MRVECRRITQLRNANSKALIVPGSFEAFQRSINAMAGGKPGDQANEIKPLVHVKAVVTLVTRLNLGF